MTDKQRARMTRRNMLIKAAAAGGLGAIFKMTEGAASGQMRGGSSVQYGAINKFSSPSALRVTDMRAVTVASNFDFNIIRLDTNQGVYLRHAPEVTHLCLPKMTQAGCS